MADTCYVDTEAITQGRKPREMYAVEFRYVNTDGKRVLQTLVFQRKSAALASIAAWDKWRSTRYEDTSTTSLYRGVISWEAA